uniref:threonine--tRNA ligase n=1 Tax=Anolis carolinensis TaxID=28377 RepID=H9G3E4_ANOCA
MAAEGLIASRLESQEREIRCLAAEIERLKEPGLASSFSSSPELEALRAENEKLRYRLAHLRRSLSAERACAKGKAGPQPEKELSFIKDRLKLYETLKKEHDALLASRASTQSRLIKITLADGKQVEGESWKTTPYQIALGISRGLADNTVIAKVNGELWDLDRPMEADAILELLPFDSEEAQAVYWHSSAHILGEAMENYYGGCLCYGPPIENGFYYDMHMENRCVSSTEFPTLENICKNIIKEKQVFERLEVRKEVLLDMFKYNTFKCRILNEKVDTPTTTVYRCGPLIDLCRGPHVRHTGKIKALKIFKNSSTYWEGKADMETLQRIYGISFPDNKMMKEWEKFQEEAKNRDHRKIGKEQELFFFHELSPGSCFFLPRGAFIYNTLIKFIKEEYNRRNFTEVVSPNVYNIKLWETSGHWQHYNENMFSFEAEKETFALKPMNCPGHCLMFAHRPRSWRELPLRLADFGVLHRNELSGTLSGLTRVRRFQQDDAHIFCTMEQIEEEMKGCLDFIQSVYAVFDNFLEEKKVWDQVCSDFFEAGFMADVDLDQSCTLNKKIRNAQLAQYNFIFVVGEKEKADRTVNVRTRDNKIHGEVSVTSAIAKLKTLKALHTLHAEEEF